MAEGPEGRVPPNNLDAEASVLGGILLRNDALDAVLERGVESEDFYHPAHRAIFEAMVALHERQQPIDIITLADQLKGDERGRRTAVSEALLADLAARVPTAANVGYYARIVHEKSSLRRMIAACGEVTGKAFSDYGDTAQFLDWAEGRVFQVAQRQGRESYVSIKRLLPETVKKIEQRYDRKRNVTGVPTEFTEFDRMTAGLQPSDLIILAARPSMGKTAWALNIAQNVALAHKIPVLVFSLEMSKHSLVERMLCAEARINSRDLRTGFIQPQQWLDLTQAMARLSEAPICIDDSGASTGLEIRAKSRRWRSDTSIFPDRNNRGMGLIVIDYLQLVRGRGDIDSREREISDISMGLKALAKELEVPVLALSQLNRGVEKRDDKRPLLSDLRECVTGDTLVVLADGRRVPIHDLVGTTPVVVAATAAGQLARARSDKVWCVGRREVYDVHLASGRMVRATARHRLLGASGWVQVGDLQPGDRLALARRLPEPETCDEWPDARVALLGHLVGDGSYVSHQPLRYTTGSEENSRLVATAARREFGARVTRHAGRGNWHQLVIAGNGNRWHPAGVGRWLRELGIFGQRSREKRLPQTVFRLADRQVALLLRHLWATDGTIAPRAAGGRGSAGVAFSTASRGLAGDVAALLLRLGIVARIHSVHQGDSGPWYQVSVSGGEQLRVFLRAVGAHGPRQAGAERLRRSLALAVPNTNVDTLPREVFGRVRALMTARGISQRAMAASRGTAYGGTAHFRFAPSRVTIASYAELLDDDELRAQATSGLFWDRVVAVIPAGRQPVYDLTVPGPASWLADGVVSHNSGALEQDADVIVFIYRDAVYQRRELRPGQQPLEEDRTAEIIIGKQRNGPTGTVNLTFMREFTRFENMSARDGEYGPDEG